MNCTCCLSTNIRSESTLTSLFLSRAAWGGPPERTNLLYCRECGFRTYERPLHESESKRYYSDYRGRHYARERSRDELFYSQKNYDQDQEWMESPHRANEMLELVANAGHDINKFRVLDYGGGNGHFIEKLRCQEKAVFDLSTTPAISGIRKLSADSELHPDDWDLIVCAQTLEHISRPETVLNRMRDIASQGGLIYIELPSQQWHSDLHEGSMRNLMLSLAVKSRRLHQLMDLYSTAFRVKLGFLPPLGFAPMREHVNFFTLESISKLGERLALSTEASRISQTCGIQILFRK